MELKYKKVIFILFAAIIHLFSNNYVQGQSWSIEYILNGDSLVYSLSQEKILQGKPVNFFFPAYKYYQTSTNDAVESVRIENAEVVEFEFNTKCFNFSMINFEIDIYAEEMDTIRFFLKTSDDRLIQISQRSHNRGYAYWPTASFSTNIENNHIKSIQIVGRSKNDDKKFIVGRMNGSKRIGFVAENMMAVDSFVSKYPFEKQSDTFVELPDHYNRLHGFNLRPRLILQDCNSTYDSIQCISQFTNKLLNEYQLYDVYGINKQELINRNMLLAKTCNDINSYYSGMKEIIVLLNSCHMRLSTSQQDEIESPLQAIYFYNINNEITVSAIFDPTLENKIHLGDRLLSINNIPLEQLYHDFSKNVFASTSQQREIKITQKLLYLSKDYFGDSLLLEFKNDKDNYFIWLNESNFSGRKIIPSNFKRVTDNTIEIYNNVMYFKPFFEESQIVPFIFSHRMNFINCDGLIIDLRGCTNADYSFCTFYSFLISDNSHILTTDSTFLNTRSDFIVKLSKQINIQASVIVLVDARTACAAELLINALRKISSNIYVIGATNTAGSAQFTMGFDLPRKAILSYFEGVAKDAFGKAIDNNVGVVPNIVVHFDSYKDLFPYDDKLKRYALKYLGYPIED